MDRRTFIKSVAASTALGVAASTLAAPDQAAAFAPVQDKNAIRNYHPQMRYRRMGNTGVDVSALGFGMLRLPLLADGKTVNEPLSVDMLRYAIDHGLNYVDAAHVYLSGQSEMTTGKALRNGYRDKVYVTSKAPWWLMDKPEDFDKMLDISRQRLQTDVIDFYLIHSVSSTGWKQKIVPFGLLDKIEKAKQDGRIRFSGFSFHDNLALFKKVVDANPQWDFCQIQLNYIDTEYEAGLVGLKYAASRGLGVVIMEVLRNGYLVDPPLARPVFDAAAQQGAHKKRSPVEWALDYVWNMPEVSVVLTGISAMRHIQENIGYAQRADAAGLDWEDGRMFGEIVQRFREAGGLPCTGCSQCTPCPQNVAIGYIMAYVYNSAILSGDTVRPQMVYNSGALSSRGRKASACDGCGECVRKCPQGIQIPEIMRMVRNKFEA